jgi:hypothetical protein
MDRRDRRRPTTRETSMAPETSGGADLIVKCSHCGRICREPGGWQQPGPAERDDEAGLRYSHGICPDCLQRHFPEFS